MKLKHIVKISLLVFSIVLILLIALLFAGYSAALKSETFLPNTSNLKGKTIDISEINIHKLTTPWFTILVDDSGRAIANSIEGETIMSDLVYYSNHEGNKENWSLSNVNVESTSDSIITVNGSISKNADVRIEYSTSKIRPKLDIKVKTSYNSETVVKREALVAKFDISVSEVYKENGEIDVNTFDTEYWLGKQGVRFGKGSSSSLIYNNPNISSLQLKTEESVLFINLDYFLDHPSVHVPFQEEATGRWENHSTAKFKTGDTRENSFSFYFSNLPKVTPRLMLVPNGNLSGYVFTEHADAGYINSHRAAYFGSEDIVNIKDATGGFAAHNIPTTKSVFYFDTVGCINDSSKNGLPFNSDVQYFLDQLNSTGIYDICLHSPENLSSNRKDLEESIAFMKKRYGTTTWIDHGMYNGLINREAYICDGLNPNTEFYTADLWEKYDTRYFWDPAIEFFNDRSAIVLSQELKNLRFYSASVNLWKRSFSSIELRESNFLKSLIELIKRYPIKVEMNAFLPNKGNYHPTPLYWKHPTRNGNFYSWKTDHTKFYANGFMDESEKQVLRNEKKQLDLLLNNWGIYIEHGYYVRTTSIHDLDITRMENGKLKVNPVFDKFLMMIAKMRDEGDLHITTIRGLLDYWVLLEKVSFEYLPNGDIKIINHNNKRVDGLSFAVHSADVLINDITPNSRKVNDEYIFWFDLPANATVNMKIKTK